MWQQYYAMCYDPGEITASYLCSEEFSCEGNALDCAIIEEQRRSRCVEFTADEGQLGADFDAIFEGEGYQDPFTASEGNTFDFEGMLETEGSLGGGSCPADLSTAILGETITFPMAPFCSIGTILGLILVASASIRAVFIVSA
jgi:hypothetical protein